MTRTSKGGSQVGRVHIGRDVDDQGILRSRQILVNGNWGKHGHWKLHMDIIPSTKQQWKDWIGTTGGVGPTRAFVSKILPLPPSRRWWESRSEDCKLVRYICSLKFRGESIPNGFHFIPETIKSLFTAYHLATKVILNTASGGEIIPTLSQCLSSTEWRCPSSTLSTSLTKGLVVWPSPNRNV